MYILLFPSGLGYLFNLDIFMGFFRRYYKENLLTHDFQRSCCGTDPVPTLVHRRSAPVALYPLVRSPRDGKIPPRLCAIGRNDQCDHLPRFIGRYNLNVMFNSNLKLFQFKVSFQMDGSKRADDSRPVFACNQ